MVNTINTINQCSKCLTMKKNLICARCANKVSPAKKEKILLNIIRNEILWMAIRYAHGRRTYAPSMIRDAIKELKEIYPDFELRKDSTIHPPEEGVVGGMSFREDYLDDLFKE